MQNGTPRLSLQVVATIFATVLGAVGTASSLWFNHNLENFKAQTEKDTQFSSAIHVLGGTLEHGRPMSSEADLTSTYVLARSLREKTMLMDIVKIGKRQDLMSVLSALMTDDPDYQARDATAKAFLVASQPVQEARKDAQNQVNVTPSPSSSSTPLSRSDAAATSTTNATVKSAALILSALTVPETTGWMWIGDIPSDKQNTPGVTLISSKLAPALVPEKNAAVQVSGDSNIRADLGSDNQLGRIIGVASKGSTVVVLDAPKTRISFSLGGQQLSSLWARVSLKEKGP